MNEVFKKPRFGRRIPLIGGFPLWACAAAQALYTQRNISFCCVGGMFNRQREDFAYSKRRYFLCEILPRHLTAVWI